MKTAKLVLIALVFAVPVLIHAQERSTAPAQAKGKATKWDSLTPLERAKEVSRIKGSRKIDIRPVKHADGIKTGMVIAYGHLIPPPYKVESVSGKVYVNGVQVVPSLVAEREIKPIQIPDDAKLRHRKMLQLEKEIKNKYYAQILLKDRGKLQAEILTFVKQNALVKDAHWGNDMLVIDYMVGGGSMVSLRGTTPAKLEPVTNKGAKDGSLTFITKGIESGCILFDSDGGATPGCGDKKTVNEIMKNSNLSKDEKIDRLAKWGNYESAMDIADNYEPLEWQPGEEQK